MGKEKDWAYELGLMDWDKTKIVFTKRQLVDFLGYVGVAVDPNLLNIAKLPRYAVFGRMSDEVAGQQVAPATQAAAVTQPAQAGTTTSSDGFKPTRRVREAPGGFQTDIFGDYEEDEAPPSKNVVAAKEDIPEPQVQQQVAPASSDGFKPTRRVRQVPGGAQTDIFGSFGDEEQEVFKPTRRVRTQPGGEDNINGLF
ncbi:hypothetical protein FRB95_009560 [Tulasnella sp. JGI-2019a]|nr:hypothetical protein FRB95_009560 [Tulasnella sp. JGI-2019a]